MNRRALLAPALAALALAVTGCTVSSEPAEPKPNLTMQPSPDPMDNLQPATSTRELIASIVDARVSVDVAGARAEAGGHSWRIGSVDGQPQAVTADYVPNRLTFTVEDGIVTSAIAG